MFQRSDVVSLDVNVPKNSQISFLLYRNEDGAGTVQKNPNAGIQESRPFAPLWATFIRRKIDADHLEPPEKWR